MSTKAKQCDQFATANRAAAELILSAPAKYGGEGALLVRWARLVHARARRHDLPDQGNPRVATGIRIASQSSLFSTEHRHQPERYKLDCARCGKTVELPAGPPRSIERPRCPQCGATLEIDWRSVGTTSQGRQSAERAG